MRRLLWCAGISPKTNVINFPVFVLTISLSSLLSTWFALLKRKRNWRNHTLSRRCLYKGSRIKNTFENTVINCLDYQSADKNVIHESSVSHAHTCLYSNVSVLFFFFQLSILYYFRYPGQLVLSTCLPCITMYYKPLCHRFGVYMTRKQQSRGFPFLLSCEVKSSNIWISSLCKQNVPINVSTLI